MSGVVRIPAGGLGSLYRAAAKIVASALRDGARLAAERSRALLVSKSPVGVGAHFKNAWKVIPGSSGQVLAHLDNDAPHAGLVERGARPHSVNEEGVAAIREWVRIKLGVPAGDVERATRSIVWHIRTHGMKASYLVRDSLGQQRQFLREEIADLLARNPPIPTGAP